MSGLNNSPFQGAFMMSRGFAGVQVEICFSSIIVEAD